MPLSYSSPQLFKCRLSESHHSPWCNIFAALWPGCWNVEHSEQDCMAKVIFARRGRRRRKITQQTEKHYCSFCLFSYQRCIEISTFLLCSRVFFFPSETQRAKVVNQWKHSRNQCHEILCSLSTVRQCPCLMMWARQKKWAMTTQRVAVSHDAVDSRAVALIRSWLKD